MIQSMTAFSRAQHQIGSNLVCWEIKSVNHRYLEMTIRLPDSFRFLENSLRGLLREQVHRGKIECVLRVTENAHESPALQVHEKTVEAILDLGNRLAEQYGIVNDITVSQLLQWPEVLRVSPVQGSAMEAAIGTLFGEAIEQLVAMRRREGAALYTEIRSRARKLAEEIFKAETQLSTLLTVSRTKWLARLKQLALDVSSVRIEQEIAVLLTRWDVSEELDRLKIHVAEVERILDNEEGAGRRLDFLMQELGREANTLSAKSDAVALAQHAVEMKVLIEQMREQIQNVE